MTVGELSRRTGTPARALRAWTDTGLVCSAGRSPAGYRLYDESAMWCVTVIGELRVLDLTIAEIRDLAAVYLGRPGEPVGPHLAALLRRARDRVARPGSSSAGLQEPVSGVRGTPADRRVVAARARDKPPTSSVVTARHCALLPESVILGLMDVLVLARTFSDSESLARRIRRWEALGVAGVLIPDHLFISAGRQVTSGNDHPDPIVLLAAIGALSPNLLIGTIVANVTFAHPALTIRHFAQLATIFGGDRVLMGLGAGWNHEEYAALGLAMPRHADRIQQLEQALRLGRSLFSAGVATIEAPGIVVRDLHLSPRPQVSPRFLIGGGSDRLLRLAGSLADWVDLNGSSRRVKLGRESPAFQDAIRRLTTTVSDLEESVRCLAGSAVDAGRSVADIRRSILIDTIEFCPDGEISERGNRLCRARLIPEVDVLQCPYVLLGSPARMRDLLAQRAERLGLSAVIVQDDDNLELFMKEVANLSHRNQVRRSPFPSIGVTFRPPRRSSPTHCTPSLARC